MLIKITNTETGGVTTKETPFTLKQYANINCCGVYKPVKVNAKRIELYYKNELCFIFERV